MHKTISRTTKRNLSSYTKLEPRRLLAASTLSSIELVDATVIDDQIVIRLDPMDTDFLEVVINGIANDRFEFQSLQRLQINADAGDDSVTIDFTHGNPIPEFGFEIFGSSGFDELSFVTSENIEVELQSINDDQQAMGQFTVTTATGTAIDDSQIVCNDWSELESVRTSFGDDQFYISDVSAIQNLQIADFNFNAGEGSNQIKIEFSPNNPGNVVIADHSIDGLFAGEFLYQTEGAGVFGGTDGTTGIELIGSDLADHFQITSLRSSDSISIDGESGDDFFAIGASLSDTSGSLINGSLNLNGGHGGDLYRLVFTNIIGTGFEISDDGTTGDDLVQVFGTNTTESFIINDSALEHRLLFPNSSDSLSIFEL
ncbi:MAG: hypothetical protein AAGA30_10765, partial [Planctomycetota bacterium]